MANYHVQNLNNGTGRLDELPYQEGENDMASKFRKTYTYVDAEGKECSILIRGSSQRDTDKKFQELLCGKRNDEASQTLKEFVDKVYRPSFMSGLSPTTIHNYERYLSLNIIPFMGNMPMNRITVATIQEFYTWMATASNRGRKNDLNAKTIERVSGFCGRIFKVAKEMKIINESPFKKDLLRNPGTMSGHHKALDDDEISRIKKLIPMLEDKRERLYMGLLVYTGMRREEVLGLRWEDLNLDENYGYIVRAVTYPDNNQPHIGKTKTDTSARTVLLPKPLVDILVESRKPCGYIFGGEKPLCYSTAKRICNRALKKLGVTGFSNHDFRTTFGTQLKEMGMSSANVADLMGHADTRMVERVYARTRHEGVMKHLNTVEALSVGTLNCPTIAPQDYITNESQSLMYQGA